MRTYFEDSKLNYLPMVEVIIQTPSNGEALKFELTMDTGFQGGVLIPLHAYLNLGLNLHEEPKITGRTATGNVVEFRVSKVMVKLDNMSVSCHAYTTLGVWRPLLGREVLKKLGLLYKPPTTLRVGLTEAYRREVSSRKGGDERKTAEDMYSW